MWRDGVAVLFSDDEREAEYFSGNENVSNFKIWNKKRHIVDHAARLEGEVDLFGAILEIFEALKVQLKGENLSLENQRH